MSKAEPFVPGERYTTPLLKWVRRWLERAEANYVLKKLGGIQKCPWCRRWMGTNEATAWHEYEEDPMLDVHCCGHCGGTSIWRWELGFFFVRPLTPPNEGDAE